MADRDRSPAVPKDVLAAQLGVTPYWICDHIYNGMISIGPDARARLYLFSNGPETLRAIQKLKAGNLDRLYPILCSAC
jgi:hypothetical protein